MKMKIVLAIVASLLMLIVCSVKGQCLGSDTVSVSRLASATSQVEAACSLACPATHVARFACPPGLYSVIIAGGLPETSIGVVFTLGCDTVLFDTCIGRNIDGVFYPVSYHSLGYMVMEVWGNSQAFYSVSMDSVSGGSAPLLTPQAIRDTLCPIVGLMPSTRLDTILVGSFNMQGRPWDGSGIRVDLYQTGTTYFTRKWWDVYK